MELIEVSGMRENKFRARCKKTGQVLDQAYNGQCFQWLHEGQNGIIIEQYTGLKDKNGKGICEGDILRTECGQIQIVKWIDSALRAEDVPFVSKAESRWYLDDTDEVIGNIYENPSLIEEKS